MITKGSPKFQEMLKFIAEGRDGLIVLSLGTTVTPESIPREALIAVGRALSVMPSHRGAIQYNNFCLSFSLQNHLSLGLRFPTIIKSSKMASSDM